MYEVGKKDIYLFIVFIKDIDFQFKMYKITAAKK